MRGNHNILPGEGAGLGSIPAHAGEPAERETWIWSPGVYPRACGGTGDPGTGGPFVSGLSPRMRGNRCARQLRPDLRGSIPAHAGEPLVLEMSRPSLGVYPRACGGTNTFGRLALIYPGLSPRMRGNHQQCHCHRGLVGSIPAHAGEPLIPGLVRLVLGVYPRACGGTRDRGDRGDRVQGLSPRMRGNPLRGTLRDFNRGSIPAHAGEPSCPAGRSPPAGVYPRACGGTHLAFSRCVSAAGLSPRMRGNLVGDRHVGGADGSIPAHAGEPRPPARRM